MNSKIKVDKFVIVAFLLCMVCTMAMQAKAYDNFKVSVYVRAYEVDKMKDIHWLDSTWNVISQQLEVDKIYLETHRDLLIVDDATLEQAKKFFHDRGIETAGGITYTINEANSFETFCYSNPEIVRWCERLQNIRQSTLTSLFWMTFSSPVASRT